MLQTRLRFASWLLLFVLPIIAWPQTGASLLPDNLYDLRGALGANAVVTPTDVAGQSFPRALRIVVNGTAARIGDAEAAWKTTLAVKRGDNLRLTFWVRKIAPLDGHNIRGFVSFGSADETATRSLYTPFPCDSETWTKYIIPFKALGDSDAGAAQLTFQFAYGPQTFEIGGLALVNLGADAPLTNAGVSALPNDIYQRHNGYIDQTVGGSITAINVSGQPFTRGYQLKHNGDSEFVFRSALGWRNATPVVKNDTLLLRFWARKIEPTGDSVIRAQVVFERASSDFAKSLTSNFPTDATEWKQYQLPFVAANDFAPNEAQLVFQFAFGPQQFELGGIELLNYGQSVKPAQLQTLFYYPGRGNLDAAWRTAANARINQHRKGNLNVTIRDRDGNPLPGAQVFVQQTEHAYRFGSAVTANLLVGNASFTDADREIYRSRVSSHFTTSVLENDLKWPLWECTNCTTFVKENTRRAITWLLDRNIGARGHNLIWPAWSNLPTNVRSLSGDALRKRIDDHFVEILSDAGVNGKLYQWDVINEPYTNYDVQGRIASTGVTQSNGMLGNEEMVRWFQMARQLDPQSKLVLNDYDILAAGGADVRHQDYLFNLSRWLLDKGAPLDAVGMQGHFNRITPPALMQTIIERFGQLPVTFAVTEYDFNIADEQMQAEFTRDVMTMIFSSPKFTDFLIWGFWERSHWLPLGAMYRADWSSKPNALVWNDLLFREWWTNETGQSDATGKFSAQGFKGSYNVTAVYQRTAKTVTTTLDANGEVNIMLDVASPRSPVKRDDGRKVGTTSQ